VRSVDVSVDAVSLEYLEYVTGTSVYNVRKMLILLLNRARCYYLFTFR
jgi:hypothetical protein